MAMLTVLLALGAAIGWGVADFTAGRLARESSARAVLALTQLIGLAACLPLLAALSPAVPLPGYMAASCASGIALAVALGALYRGMALGSMGIVSSIAATGTVIPVVVGLAQGDRPTVFQAIGLGLAMIGVGLAQLEPTSDASGSDDQSRTRPRLGAGVRWGLLAAVAGGATSVAIAKGSGGGVLGGC